MREKAITATIFRVVIVAGFVQSNLHALFSVDSLSPYEARTSVIMVIRDEKIEARSALVKFLACR